MSDSPTIRSLAALAGVSKSTVSLALRGHPRIRASERERIQKIAAEAGYKPNALVANLLAYLRSKKTSAYQSTLGLVYVALGGPAQFEAVDTYQQWFVACKARARQLGYGIDEFSLHEPEMSPKRLVQILDARNIRGLIVVGPFPNRLIPPETDLIWQRSASVVIGVRPSQFLACAVNDQFSTSAQAVSRMRQLGYRRLGLCLNSGIDAYVEGRFQGGFDMARKDLPENERLPVFDFRLAEREKFVQWVRQHRPDGLVTLHHEVKEWLEAMGMDVPGDIGVMHLDRSPSLKNWAGMQQNNVEIGHAAVDMVVRRLHRDELGIPAVQKCTVVASNWLPGATVRKQDKPSPTGNTTAAKAKRPRAKSLKEAP